MPKQRASGSAIGDRRSAVLVLVALSVCLLVCSRGGLTNDVEIEVEIDESLEDDIQVVSAVGNRPGSVNPVDAVVELKNIGAADARVLCEGSWHGHRGNYYGGTSSVRILQPHQTHTIESGTRSETATRFKLEISRTEMTGDELLTSMLNEDVPRADGYGFTYTETPTADQIPAWELRGVANGEPFQVRTILFSPILSQWTLQLIDSPVDPLTSIASARLDKPNIQHVSIDLPREPASGDVFEKELSWGDGYFQIKTSPDSQETTSWNTDMAWFIEITEWDQKSWTEGAGTFQLGGTASGRLYISFKGTEHGLKNSWVSGVFEDAPIVYYGKP